MVIASAPPQLGLERADAIGHALADRLPGEHGATLAEAARHGGGGHASAAGDVVGEPYMHLVDLRLHRAAGLRACGLKGENRLASTLYLPALMTVVTMPSRACRADASWC